MSVRILLNLESNLLSYKLCFEQITSFTNGIIGMRMCDTLPIERIKLSKLPAVHFPVSFWIVSSVRTALNMHKEKALLSPRESHGNKDLHAWDTLPNYIWIFRYLHAPLNRISFIDKLRCGLTSFKWRLRKWFSLIQMLYILIYITRVV